MKNERFWGLRKQRIIKKEYILEFLQENAPELLKYEKQ